MKPHNPPENPAATVTIHTVTKDWIAEQIRSLAIKTAIVSITLVTAAVLFTGGWMVNSVVVQVGEQHEAFVKTQRAALDDLRNANRATIVDLQQNILQNVSLLSNQVIQLNNQVRELQAKIPKQRAGFGSDSQISVLAGTGGAVQ